MKKGEKTKRLPPYSYRPPAGLRVEFDQRVKQSGLSTSAYLTQSWYGQPLSNQRKIAPEQVKMLARILADCGKIRDQLNEIAPGQEGDLSALEQACEELALIRAALVKQMGRKP